MTSAPSRFCLIACCLAAIFIVGCADRAVIESRQMYKHVRAQGGLSLQVDTTRHSPGGEAQVLEQALRELLANDQMDLDANAPVLRVSIEAMTRKDYRAGWNDDADAGAAEAARIKAVLGHPQGASYHEVTILVTVANRTYSRLENLFASEVPLLIQAETWDPAPR